MSRTITALFDDRDDAMAGRQRLLDARIDADNIRIHDKSELTADGYSDDSHHGFWASIKNAFLPDEDRHAYEEGLRRGGYLLTADVDSDEIDDAIRALEDARSVDLDERSTGWRKEGWTAPVAARTDMSANKGQTLDVVQEELVVGKREVERGGVRVRSYITEKPVHEQIALRKERVNVERHPVDRAGTVGDAAFQDRTVEVTATSEEAVVGKTARVVEEVVVTKDVDVENKSVDGTVRRQDVEVEQLDGRRSMNDRTDGNPRT